MTTPRSDEPRTCLNCSAILVGRFCADCGQKEVDPDKGLLEVVLELVGEAFEADGRLHRTVIPFFFQPGRLTAEWMAGRRVAYTSPPRVFVFALFVGFLGLSFATARELSSIPDEPVAREGDRMVVTPDGGGRLNMEFDIRDATFDGTQRELATEIVEEVVEQGPKLVVALVPLLALALKLVLRSHTTLSHLVFSLLLHARMHVLGAIAMMLPWDAPQQLVGLAVQVYLGLGMKRAYDLTWKQAIWRYLVVAALYLTCWILGMSALAVWSAWTLFG